LLLNWGVGSLLFGLLTFGYGIWPGQNDYVKDLGLVITIFGTVLTTCGWQVMKIAWFPIAFLVCALPWPGLVYSWVAGPLQQLAASAAVVTLNITGVAAKQLGTKIVIPTDNPLDPRVLNVAEACAGLRSLMTFITMGAALAFLSSRPLWQKLLITAMAVPVAILCNVMRVSGQGLLDTYVSQELAEGFAHQFVGLIMLIPAFFMLLGIAWVVDQLFVEEAEARAVQAKRVPDKIVRRAPQQQAKAAASAAAPQPAPVEVGQA
jgi:exosortase